MLDAISEPHTLESQDSPAQTLSITSLSLHHFRNYSSARIEVSPAPVVLTGKNGAGKTNILEALSLLTPGRGLRRAKLSEIDNRNETTPWAISATVLGLQGEVKIGTGRDPEAGETEKRIVRLDGNPLRSQAELSRHLAIIWLMPQMEQLFNEGASSGRKFLDRLVYSFDPEHAARVNEYEYAMRERNRLLQWGQGDQSWLEALEQTMAEMACAIAAARLTTVANLNHAIALSELSFPKARLAVCGVAEDCLVAGEPAVQVEDGLKTLWAASRREDAAAGRTLAGAHRSELQVKHVEKDISAAFCSTGEQKALLLSIVLGQARAGALWKETVPVLLLDEVVAHLDASRRRELFEEIEHVKAQVWMTGTEPALFSGMREKATFLKVDDGAISIEK